MKPGKKFIIFPILYMIAIFIMSSIPDNDATEVSRFFQSIDPGLQNLLHIPLYAGLTTLWILYFLNRKKDRQKILFLSFTISWFYSLLDEFHQYFIPGRFPGLTDVILNTVGVLITIFAFSTYFKLNIGFSMPTTKKGN